MQSQYHVKHSLQTSTSEELLVNMFFNYINKFAKVKGFSQVAIG